jgi:hypothetical protein
MILAKKLEGYNFYVNYIIISYIMVESFARALREMSESVFVSINATLSNDVCICNTHVCVCVCVIH